ncbi:MAG: hypothetical protein EXR07_19690 [Acetobacteraceae bacterium]|nr:hypothetical protein [Acetobacteraceae bacterium]
MRSRAWHMTATGDVGATFGQWPNVALKLSGGNFVRDRDVLGIIRFHTRPEQDIYLIDGT